MRGFADTPEGGFPGSRSSAVGPLLRLICPLVLVLVGVVAMMVAPPVPIAISVVVSINVMAAIVSVTSVAVISGTGDSIWKVSPSPRAHTGICMKGRGQEYANA
jgi:hypothetical protein